MSEKLPLHEHHSLPEISLGQRAYERRELKSNESPAEAEIAAKRSLENIRQHISEQAKSRADTSLPSSEANDLPPHYFLSKQLKAAAQHRLLKRVREQLPLTDKALSRIVNQPMIDEISEVTSKTIARPSGLLSGGFFALVGSSILLYADHRYGYRYNFLFWLLFFVGGFVLGLIIEGLARIIIRHRHP